MAIPITSDILKTIRKICHKPSGKVVKFKRDEFLQQARKEWSKYLKEKEVNNG